MIGHSQVLSNQNKELIENDAFVTKLDLNMLTCLLLPCDNYGTVLLFGTILREELFCLKHHYT